MATRKRQKNHTIINREAGPFLAIFEKLKWELTEEVLRGFGLYGRKELTLTGTAAESTQRMRAYHIRRVDNMIRKYMPQLYKYTLDSLESTYQQAVGEARTYYDLSAVTKLEELGTTLLYTPTLEVQRHYLENELTAAAVKAGQQTVRLINSYSLSAEQRGHVQQAVAEGMVRGKGVKGVADTVFKTLSAMGDDVSPDILQAVRGKFIRINGRNFDLAKYSELIAKSRLYELYNQAQINEYAEDGYMAVQVDDHNTTADICKPFEGTIWTLTGKAIRGYRPLSECLNGGPPFHPRCSHYTDPVDIMRGRAQDTVFEVKGYTVNEAVLGQYELLKLKQEKIEESKAVIFYKQAA